MSMIEEDFETSIKVIVVGNGGIGKTSLIQKFAKGIFTEVYKKTIGVDFLEKQMYIPSLGDTVTMMLWDTAGQEEFDAVTRKYYRGAGACVIAFSTTDRQSFDDVAKWKQKVEAECGPRLPMVLMQNKVDLIDQAVMTKDEAEATAAALGLRFYRTCVKENMNVNEVFTYLAEQYVQRTKEVAVAEPVAAIGFEVDSAARQIAAQQLSSSEPTSAIAAPPTPSKQQQQPPPVQPNLFAATPSKRDPDVVSLGTVQPSKVRTGGKKTRFFNCVLL
eukprot:TRINITY_DN133_c0_g6_i1.p1 TRINITY_DN133_c0_g6~~TRINITY_DN133_c0_g6_i1.p1  ORF type:complete len:293 (-),score=58.35 TRINITY_DN133_c0_g6_i1:28-849(-)